jgi:hypothetical protein
VIEMSLSNWLVAGIVPGVERQPLKKLAVDESALLKLLNRWREEAEKAGRKIEHIAVAFEAGRDGFWLAGGIPAPNRDWFECRRRLVRVLTPGLVRATGYEGSCRSVSIGRLKAGRRTDCSRRGTLAQYAGRLHRLHAAKREVVI